MNENPFERYDLDPREGPRGITERLRELLADADSDEARAEIRAAWEELTLHPAKRLSAAIGAHPETRPPLGGPPPSPMSQDSAALPSLAELTVRPSVTAALRHADAAARRPSPLSLSDDPLLTTTGDT